jgi:hypothetical protein
MQTQRIVAILQQRQSALKAGRTRSGRSAHDPCDQSGYRVPVVL